MASYNGKDIDRVCRAAGMSRGRAEALLRQYDGRPDRVLEERCGARRVYLEPESVSAPENAWQTAWQSVAGFFGHAWEQVVCAGRKLVGMPALPVILLALAAAPAAILLALTTLFMKLPL